MGYEQPVRLLPGVQPADARKALYELSLSASNMYPAAGQVASTDRKRYLEWVDQSTAALRHLIHANDIHRLLLTRRYWALLQWVATGVQDPALRGLVSTEIDELKRSLTSAVEALDAATGRWEHWDVLVAPDTNLLLHNPQPLEEADWHDLAEVAPNERLLVVLPILVVDQLDKAKTGKNETRSRARTTTRTISELLPRRKLVDHWTTLHEPRRGTGSDDPDRELIGLAVVLDPADHVRLPETDDEIADRALWVSELAHGEVRLLTYDAGMALRSRAIGLTTVHLKHAEEAP